MIKRIILILVCLAVVGAALAYFVLMQKSSLDESVRIYIPRTATSESIKDTLCMHLGDDFGTIVHTMWSAKTKNPARANGSYVVEPGKSAFDVARMLVQGHQSPVRITLNNMRTLADLAGQIDEQLEITADEFLAAVDTILPKNAEFKEKEEYLAAFLPDTYEFYWNTSAAKAVKRLLDVRNRFWNDDRRAKAKALGYSPVEIASLASIVEEESNAKSELSTIARLYMNRLKIGMLLQADPTVKFAVGDFTLRRINNQHLKTPSAYNTYLHQGLPPGPIRIAEKATIDAVLNAPKHNYLYMCAKEDFSGRHNFASDYSTHLRNAARYHAALNKRGIR